MDKTIIDGQDRWRNPYKRMQETTAHGWDQWRTTNYRRFAEQLLMGETEQWIHTRWCSKQLLMDDANEGLPMPDDVQNNCWLMRHMRIHGRWCTQQLLMDETMKDYPHQVMKKTTAGVWHSWRHPYQTMHECSCSWLRPRKDYLNQKMCKTTVDRWETDDRVSTRWCTIHKEHPLSGDVHNNCRLMIVMKESMPDDVRNKCWWLKPTQDYACQMMYKTTVDGRDRIRNPYQMM